MIQPRPLGPRKTVQLMVVLTILAWATQVLFHQWGFGGVITSSALQPPEPQASSLNEVTAELAPSTQPTFSLPEAVSAAASSPASASETSSTQTPPASAAVTPASAAAIQATVNPAPVEAKPPTLELRAEATIDGSEVTLKQLCRWSDDQSFAPLADTVVIRLSQTNPVRQIGVSEIKSALHDAGANLSQIQFAGSATCAVRRSEVDDATFARLIAGDANQTSDTATANARAADADPSAVTPADPIVADTPQTPLFELLTTDLSDRLKLSASNLDIRFDVHSMPSLFLTSPRCRFDIDSQRINGLGAVSWDVTIHSDAGDKTTTIVATALAWQDQVVMTRALSAGQLIQSGDVIARRALVDKISETPLAFNPDNLVGQQLKTSLRLGDVLLVSSIKSVPLIAKGQFITVSIPHDGTMIETAARAIDSGGRGETIHARNEATNQIYSVVVTSKGCGEVTSIGEQDIAQTSRDSATER